MTSTTCRENKGCTEVPEECCENGGVDAFDDDRGDTFMTRSPVRARSIPDPLAWLGVLASVLLVVGLPVQLAGFLPASLAWPMWMPMLAFEVTLAFWLLIKGVAVPAQQRSGRD